MEIFRYPSTRWGETPSSPNFYLLEIRARRSLAPPCMVPMRAQSRKDAFNEPTLPLTPSLYPNGGYLFRVAAAILAAVKGGILPPGKNAPLSGDLKIAGRLGACVGLFRRAGCPALRQARTPAATPVHGPDSRPDFGGSPYP